MILEVSPGSPAGLLLELSVSVTLESLDDRVKDDDVSKELLDATSAEELDSSTALLSVFSGPEPLESSPQATNIAENVKVKNACKRLLKIILILFNIQPFFPTIINFHKHIIITSKIATNRRNQIALIF